MSGKNNLSDNLNGKKLLMFDLGTSGNKAALFDFKLNCISQAYEKYPLDYPKPGWAEQDPEDFWNSVKKNISTLIKTTQMDPMEISALSFTGQMNCTIPIDKEGTPLMRAISWLDTRASEIILKKMKGLIKYKGMSLKKTLFFKKHSGGVPGKSGKDPISHYLWLKEYAPDIYEKTYKFLSVKDYMIYRCTNCAVTSKDLANTSWLKDPITDEYSKEILKLTEIDPNKLPEIRKSTDIAGKLLPGMAKELGLVPDIPVFVGSGDITSVALGSGGIRDNEIIVCLGTADWVGAHLPERKTDIPNYIGTINSAQDNYLYLSKQETGAACFNWIMEQMYKDLIAKFGDQKTELYQHLDSIVEKVQPGSKKLIFTPWMFGERSPINNSEVRGGFFNLGLDHDREDMLRAVYEGVAFNIKWGLDPIEKKIGKCDRIKIIGGAANSDIWCQIISDILTRDVEQIKEPSLGGVRGSAIITLVGLGILTKFADAIPLIKVEKTLKPNPNNQVIYAKLFKEFEKIYKRNKSMFKNLNL